MSKVRNGERGSGGVERRLVAHGARPRNDSEPGRAWLEEALHTVGALAVLSREVVDGDRGHG
ncbi:hypothetical protein [Streptomyces europaeiscabiei]|uniref:hypothetical protein n=1 Tax=Streptomyces europaeiscabiei TaxID=146819 RepID=UPI002E17931B